MAQIPQDNPAPVRLDDAGLTPGPAAAPTPSTTAKAGRAVREIVETLLLAALIFFAVRLVVLNFKVDGASMSPNLHNEEMLLVNRNAYANVDLGGVWSILPGEDDPDDAAFYPFAPPDRGDIVVFNPPTKNERTIDKPYIKRIIGLPGEQVSFAEGAVFVNGQQLEEPYIEAETTCDGGPRRCSVLVPEDHVFVLGDNRTNSSDSRDFGTVPVDRVIGKAWFAYWPPADIGLVPHHDYPGIPDAPAAAATPVVVADDRDERDDRQRDREERRRERSGDVVASPVP